MPLNVDVFGPDDPHAPAILAVHGLTGHGRRWRLLAEEHLPGVRVIAPDLLGHGFSPFTPPWSIDANVDGLIEVIDTHLPDDTSPILLGHSFGGAISVHLAHRLHEAGRGPAEIILLDPAQGLDPEWALRVATDSLEDWDYADADAARAAKRSEGWADIPDRVLDNEIDDHLVDLGPGRVGWRVSKPGAATAWSEMSRPHRLPPAGVPTTVVVADRVDPPFVRAGFLADLPEQVEIIHADCEHMVPFLAPDLVARLVRRAVDRRDADRD